MFGERTGRAQRRLGSRLSRARSGPGDRHGHYLSRMRLSDGRSEPMSILPSKASTRASLRSATETGAISNQGGPSCDYYEACSEPCCGSSRP